MALGRYFVNKFFQYFLEGQGGNCFCFNCSTILEVPYPFSEGVTSAYIIFEYKDTGITWGQDAYDFTADWNQQNQTQDQRGAYIRIHIYLNWNRGVNIYTYMSLFNEGGGGGSTDRCHHGYSKKINIFVANCELEWWNGCTLNYFSLLPQQLSSTTHGSLSISSKIWSIVFYLPI